MEPSTVDEGSRSSRDNSIKDLGTSQSSLKSTKSLDKSSTSGSFKERNSIQFKTEVINHEIDNQRLPVDASLKVPHKIIANWRSACDRTRDKTKDLLKRWRTLPEIEGVENVKQTTDTAQICENQQDKSSWSVHVWTTWVDRFSVESEEGLHRTRVGEIINLAYEAMTSNGDHPLHFRAYRLCFSNYLLGRHPNGPGHHILGAPVNPASSIMFPVDYSALNADPEDLEQYAPNKESNRRSVIV